MASGEGAEEEARFLPASSVGWERIETPMVGTACTIRHFVVPPGLSVGSGLKPQLAMQQANVGYGVPPGLSVGSGLKLLSTLPRSLTGVLPFLPASVSGAD